MSFVDSELEGIALEMSILLSFVLVSELLRRTLARDAPSWKYFLWISSLVAGWYMVSVTLVLFNKWVLVRWQRDGIKITVFYTTTHMFLKGVFAAVYMSCTGTRPANTSGKAFLFLSGAGMMAALDIVTSNLSMLHISATFYTFLKSASLVFIFLGATIAGVEEPSISLVIPVALVAFGLLLATAGEPDFKVLGFGYVMASEAFAATRWVLTQIILQQDRRLNAMTCVLLMAPASTLTLTPFTIALERNSIAEFFDGTEDLYTFGFIVLFPGFLAFVLLLLEVQLVKDTSSMTLTVFGNLKSVITILFAIVVFGDKTTVTQWIGLIVAIAGLVSYSHSRGEWNFEDLTITNFAKNERASLVSGK